MTTSSAAVRTGLIPLVSCALAAAAALFLQPTPAPSLAGLQRPAQAHARAAGAPEPTPLREVSLEWNIAAVHEQSSDPLSSIGETLGAGVCAIDFNRDGWIDLFFVGGRGHTREYGRTSWWRESLGNRLLMNQGGHHFEDVTARAKLDVSMWGMACSVGDLDNDGFADLIVTGVHGNRVFHNRPDGTFDDVTAHSGIVSDAWSTGASLSDFNGDGLLDVYVSNYILFEKGARTFERTSGFRSAADSAFDQTLYDAEPKRLYLNRGDLRFQDVTEEMGVSDAVGRSLGARWTDLNGDSWPDLLVINDHDTPNQVYVNEHGRHFARAVAPYSALEVAGAHDVAIADFDNDGSSEFFMSRGRGRPPVWLAFSARDERYRDLAWERGAASPRLLPFSGWSALAADMNNDGYLDLYVANGSLMPDADTRYVAQAQPNSLFLNDQQGGFRLQPAAANAEHPLSSRGAIAVDLDNDGQLELVVANNNDALQVFTTSGTKKKHWLVLDLHSAQHDAEIYGATVTAETQAFVITRTVEAPQHFLAQSDPRIHLGLGEATRVKALRIAWRDGTTSLFRDVAVDQFLKVDRAAAALTAQRYGHAAEVRSNEATASDQGALLCLARILLAKPAADQDISRLRALWDVASADSRSAILDGLPEAPAPGHLALLRDALRDPARSVRLTSVRALQHLELERSVAWLIPLLEQPDPPVQCAVSEVFRYFFDEEEAVTQRKALAIAPLIRILESSTAAVQVCAATALAAAESKRAVLPLIELTGKTQVTAVRVAAGRALGLIRDTRALATLHGLITNANTDGESLAAALVALSRLNDPNTTALLDSALGGVEKSLAPDALAKRFVAIAYLLAEPGDLVFAKSVVVRHLQALLTEAALSGLVAARGADVAGAIALLRAITASRESQLEAVAARFLAHPEASVRIQAMLALASLDTARAWSLVGAKLAVEPINVASEVLARLTERNDKLRPWLLAQFFARTGASQPVLELLRKLPKSAASAALDVLLHANRTPEELAALLELCGDASLEIRAPAPAYPAHASLTVRANYFACLLDGASDTNPSARSQEQMLARSTLNSVLADPSLAPNERLTILLAAARRDPIVATTWLAKELADIPSERLPEVVQAFQTSGSAGAIRDDLRRYVADAKAADALRMQAAEALSAEHDDRVAPFLYGRMKAPR